MQSPYTEYDKEQGIEKASVQLVGYAKTDMLDAGASATVTVTVPKEQMKVYDANGYGTYIVDAGDYYFTAANNAHEAVNNILAAKGYSEEQGMDQAGNADQTSKVTVNEIDAKTYAASQATGNEIANQFEDVDIKKYDDSYQYLSRSDWTGTWPETYNGGTWEAPDALLSDLELHTDESSNSAEPVTGTVDETEGKLSAASLIGLDYDDELWMKLVQQMSQDEVDELVRIGGYATKSVKSIQLPETVDKDGPAGISGTLVGGESGTSYPPEVVLASTWNDDLSEEFGKCIGEDSLALGVQVWYAPACNIHRSPYSGRNFEYYSEDSFLSGKMAATTSAGAQSKGAVVTVKHFALNDQETNRMGCAIFANEQSVRQVYLAAFETAVREGDAHGVMVSMNRIGSRWTGGHYGLMTATLRDEWGFKGMAVTDQASYAVFAYEDMREGLAAGTDLWLNTDATLWKLSDAEMTNEVVNDMQRAAKNVVYAIAGSNAMNGLAADSKVVSVVPLWKKGLYALDVVAAIGILITLFFTTRSVIRKRKQKKAEN